MRPALLLLLLIPLAFDAQTGTPNTEQPYMIAGRVYDSESGIALAGAEVAIAPVAHRNQLASVFTNTQGLFWFRGLQKGKYVLQAARQGFAAESYQEHLGYSTAIAVGPGLDSVHITFPLRKPGTIFGAITDQDGDPVPNAEVYLFEQQVRDGLRGTWMLSEVETNNDGTYRLNKLRPGNYFIAVSARPWYARNAEQLGSRTATADDQALDVAYPVAFYPQGRSASEAAPIKVESGSKVEADVVLTSMAAARVQLRVPSGARIVRAYFELGSDWATDVRQGPGWWGDGSQVHSVAPGTYRMVALWDDAAGRHSTRRMVSVAGDVVLDLSSDQELVISANLIGGGNTGASVPPLALRNVRTGMLVRARSAENGRVEWRGGDLSPERYELVVAVESDTYIKSIAVSGAKVSGRALDLPPSGRVQMNVTLANGPAVFRGVVKQDEKAVGGAMVLLLPDDLASDTALARRDQSDSDGTFLLRNVVPGNYTLIALPSGSEDVEYLRPQVIAPYLASGRRLAIEPNGRYQIVAKLSLNKQTMQDQSRLANKQVAVP
jgi:protocatechuate 3,4-dioxygenase beta subunit